MSESNRSAVELVHLLQSTTPSKQQPRRSRTVRAFRALAIAAFALAVPGAIVGFAMDDALALAISAACMGTAFVALDAARAGRGALTPITLYAFTWTLSSIANAIAIANQDTEHRSLFFIYAVDEHLPLAMKISWLGLVATVAGFRLAANSPFWRSLGTLLPRVSGEIRTNRLLPVCLGAAALGIASKVTGIMPSLGTLTSIIYFFPHLAAFTLARAGVMMRWRTAVWIGLAIALAETVRALMTAYLRTDIFSPVFAYAIGVLMGAQSLRALRSVYMAPVYAVAVPFVIYFAAFAQVRGQSGSGVERLWDIAETRQIQEETQTPTQHSLLSRMSSINQLTQLGRVVEEDGHLGGSTLEYLAYAWIPRFLWPEKPAIAKGAWYALRIGQARVRDGRITNSVNMTIPGELYLNFSWLGLLFGCLAYGGLLGLLWNTTGFWRERQNVLGAAYGFYLLWIGFAGGADLQIIVTMVAMYVLFAGASIFFSGGERRATAPRAAAPELAGSGR